MVKMAKSGSRGVIFAQFGPILGAISDDLGPGGLEIPFWDLGPWPDLLASPI